ncbi:MAG: LytTR family DNA-binding domain-containing protein [Bacteroidota bacterium]
MKTYRALLVDDEIGNLELLATLIAEHCPEIEQLYQAQTVHEAQNVLLKDSIDVVFLDVELVGATGFDLLNQLEQVDFSLIFVTAFDAYALKAIKYSALDYLLKPVDPIELKKAVQKLMELKPKQQQLDLLSYNLNHQEARRIALSTKDEIHFVRVNDIIRLEGAANYTHVFRVDEKPLLLSGNIGHFERLLQDANFYRPHQSHLIHLQHIKKYVKSDGGYFLMADEGRVPIARLKREEVKRILLEM